MKMQEEKYQGKTKVLFVTASTKGGGAERMLFNIIRSLDANHVVRLFVTSDEHIPEVYKTEKIQCLNADKQHAMSAFPKLIKDLKHYKPQHVFTTSSNIGYMIILAKKILRADFKIYIRCAVTPSEIYQSDIRTIGLNYVNRLAYNSADLVIAQTDFMRGDLIDKYHIKPSKVKTIRNIVDSSFIQSQSLQNQCSELKSDDYNIVACGALYSVKGFDLLIKALSDLLKETNRHLYILGEERYEPGYRFFLQSEIDKLGLSQHIHLLGQKVNPYPYFKKANLFVMSSRKEGYPNVVLEALTLGVPVVATDVVDWTGVIKDGKNGYIAKKNNVDSIKEALVKAFNAEFKMESETIENYNYNELFN